MRRRLVGWSMAAMAAGLAVGILPAAQPNGPSNPPRRPAVSTDYARHVSELRGRLPDSNFTIVQEPPFVVVGDEKPEMVRQRAKGTVKWAVDRLKAQFFSQDPAEIIDIWLFKDEDSYERHTPALFGRAPTTPFGCYLADHRALVMNIATGGGTLVHEIVHPLMAANFPECPAWFNEGMGSLYEQSEDVDGKIRGMTNWRLEGLQTAIRRGRLPSFHALCSTTDAQFYGEDRGTNYAQARYLCYYLQEHQLLEKFYRQFHANVGRDPTGYRTLTLVLGRADMDGFQKEWESFVLKLRFP